MTKQVKGEARTLLAGAMGASLILIWVASKSFGLPPLDLSVAQSGPSTYTVGQQFHYTITVTVSSGTTNVTLTDVLPAGVNFVLAGSTSGCSDPGAGGTVTCYLASVSGTTAFTIQAMPTSSAGNPIVNVVGVVGSSPDSNMTNNSSSLSIPLGNAPTATPTRTTTPTPTNTPTGPTPTRTPTPTPSAPIYQGYFDGPHCQILSGWAWDETRPNTPINVDIYDGSTYVLSASANLFRQDLLNAGIGNGYHAFSVGTPSRFLDGQTHSVDVKFGGTQTSLTWSPTNLTCNVTMYTSQLPATTVATGNYEDGTQFSSSQAGNVTAIRFYKASGETGTHVGRLWSDSGSLLASVTFTNETASGWQEQALATPYALAAGTKYRVSYNENAILAKTQCASPAYPFSNGPLTALMGYYATPIGTFPTTSSCSAFFADVRFSE